MSEKKKKEDSDLVETDGLGRRVWDKEEYAKKARERHAEQEEKDSGVIKRPAIPVQRDDLKKRDFTANLEARVGKSRVIGNAHDSGGGYFCKVCDCVLKDSINYLDHINGKKHQKTLGMSMRVSRSSVDDVKDRIAAKKRKIAQHKKGPETYDLDTRVAALQEEEQERTRKQREKQKTRKIQKKQEDIDASGADPDMMKMMGFSGFG